MINSLPRRSHAYCQTMIPCRLRKILLCFLVSFVLSISAVYAGVVKSAGVPRVVDGPQGEVVVDSVLDDADKGKPNYNLDENASSLNQNKPKEKPNEPEENVNSIEYHDSDIVPEDTVTPEKNNDTFKLIAIGAIVLLLGLIIVFIANKRK